MLIDYMIAAGTGDEDLIRLALEAFDRAYYLDTYADVRQFGMDAFEHYLKHGWQEGRNPSQSFSTLGYLRANPHLIGRNVNPFLDHVNKSRTELQKSAVPEADPAGEVNDLSPLMTSLEYQTLARAIDVDFYRLQLKDLEFIPDPAAHYLSEGAASGLDPHPEFSTTAYLAANTDVRDAGVNPYYHYISTGRGEARVSSPSTWRPAVSTGHSVQQAAPTKEQQSSVILNSPLNEQEFVSWNLKSERPDHDALLQYYYASPPEHRPPLTPFFDAGFYSREYGQHIAPDFDPYCHFLSRGFELGFDPHPFISTKFCIDEYRKLHTDAEPTLADIAEAIKLDLIDPHPLYVGEYYGLTNGDVRKAGVPLFRHFVQSGAAEGRLANEYFDVTYYISNGVNVPEDKYSATVHFYRQGDVQGVRPGPMFDAQAYVEKYADQSKSEFGALAHFIRIGKGLGRRAMELAAISVSAALEPQPILLESHLLEIQAARKLLSEYRTRRISGFAERDSLVITDELLARVLQSDHQPVHSASQKKSKAKGKVAGPKVSLIVPVYGCLNLVERCLVSLYADPWVLENCEVIVADDHPVESSKELTERFNGALYLSCEKNLGFLRNCNRAVAVSRGESFLLVNSDLEIPTGCVEKMWDVLAQEPDVAIVGPKIIYPNGRLQEAGCLVNLDGSGELIGPGDDPDAPEYSWSRDVDYLSGAFMLVRATAWNEVSGFDDALAPSYCEDLDLCLAVRNKGYRIRYVADAVVVHHLSASHQELTSTTKLQRVATNQQKIAAKWRDTLLQDRQVSVISYYLPQFHTTPENDLWWGNGFTEWTNCTKARPNFVGHYQPHLPTDMGFYDLSAPDTLAKQFKLANRYGVDGFCIHYYNFGGRRILETPTEIILSNPDLDIKFCLCWANENWTKNWDGGEREVLLQQIDTVEGQDAVIHDVIRHMKDPRYIRVNGRPLFVLYRPAIVANLASFADRFRVACAAAGLPPPLLTCTDGLDGGFTKSGFEATGFDAGVEFSPHGFPTRMAMPGDPLNENFRGSIFDYVEASRWLVSKTAKTFPYFRCAFPSWDNTARRQQDGNIFFNATPEMFQAQVEALIRQAFQSHPSGARVVFVNAWNEWAEGAHLEPDRFFGHRWLEAIRNARITTGTV